MVRKIATYEPYLIDLDDPVRLGDTIEWYWDDETPDDDRSWPIFDGVLPREEIDSILVLAGVEVDDEDQESIIRGTVTAIDEVRAAMRRVPGTQNSYEYIAGSAVLVQRSELDPRHHEPHNADDHFCFYLVTVDDS